MVLLPLLTSLGMLTAPVKPGVASATAPSAAATSTMLNAAELTSAPKGWVVLFLSSRCPCSAAHEPVAAELASRFGGQFKFVAVNSNSDETPEESLKHFQAAQLPFPVLRDQDTRLADVLGAFKTPHAFVLSPDGQVLFSGGVDDSSKLALAKHTYLKDTLVALSEGREPETRNARALGCVIKRK